MNKHTYTTGNSDSQIFCYQNCVSNAHTILQLTLKVFRTSEIISNAVRHYILVIVQLWGYSGWGWSDLLLNILFWSRMHESYGSPIKLVTFLSFNVVKAVSKNCLHYIFTWNLLKTICHVEFWPKLYNIMALRLKYGYWNILLINAKFVWFHSILYIFYWIIGTNIQLLFF
jgi:hypothetical protein